MTIDDLEVGTFFTVSAEGCKAAQNIVGTGPVPKVLYQLTQAGTLYPGNSSLLGAYAIRPCISTLGNSYGSWSPKVPGQELDIIPQTLPITRGVLPARTPLVTSCDPEMFLEDAKGNIVPGFSVLPPKKQPMVGFSGVFHEDGFQAELSPEPRQCHEEVMLRVSQVMRDMVHHADCRAATATKISDLNFVTLTPEQLAQGTDAQVALGCDSSENVWGHPNFVVDNSRKFPHRMAGGHLHFGTPASAPWLHKRAERIITAMDVFCGVPSVALFAGLDDTRRREYYGRAGEFRFQKHGLEYRVLSNSWLRHPALGHLTLNLARGAFRVGMMDWMPHFPFDPGLVRHIINDYDVEAAQKFIDDNAAVLLWMLEQDCGYAWAGKGLRVIHSGARSVFKRLGIHHNWLGVDRSIENTRFNDFIVGKKIAAPFKKAPKEVEEPATTPILSVRMFSSVVSSAPTPVDAPVLWPVYQATIPPVPVPVPPSPPTAAAARQQTTGTNRR